VAPRLATDDNRAFCIDAVDFKYRFRDVETDCDTHFLNTRRWPHAIGRLAVETRFCEGREPQRSTIQPIIGLVMSNHVI
jgi:hypothetical protein